MRDLQVRPILPAPILRTRQRIGETVQRATEAAPGTAGGRGRGAPGFPPGSAGRV
jgi:hypothetical protein